MKNLKLLISVVLWLGVIGMGYWLYRVIQEPIEFKAEYEKRRTATINRLIDIREAQGFYLDVNGNYANQWDDLINSIKLDSLMVIKTFGDPDDTTIVTTFDTSFIMLRDTINFVGTRNLDSLKVIPFSGGQLFELESDILTQQRVKIPVYQVQAFKSQYLKGLNKDLVTTKRDLVLGSLSRPSESGSWE